MTQRLIGVVIAILAAVFTLPPASVASAALEEDPRHAYTYDMNRSAAELSTCTTERGLPAHCRFHTSYYPADPRSHGASARPGRPTPRVAATYDESAALVPVTRSSRRSKLGSTT